MKKGRNWAFVVYPDSLPKNYQEIIQNLGLPMAWSPLHDKDIEPTGEVKKPHFHVICYYENTTTYKNVKENVCDLLNGTIPIKLESMVGMYRYHLHLDNPEKYQYDDRLRTFYNGFDVAKVSALTTTEVNKLVKEIQDLIVKNHFTEYSEVIDFLKDNDLNDMYDVAMNKTYFFNTYIRSRKTQTLQEKHIDI